MSKFNIGDRVKKLWWDIPGTVASIWSNNAVSVEWDYMTNNIGRWSGNSYEFDDNLYHAGDSDLKYVESPFYAPKAMFYRPNPKSPYFHKLYTRCTNTVGMDGVFSIRCDAAIPSGATECPKCHIEINDLAR